MDRRHQRALYEKRSPRTRVRLDVNNLWNLEPIGSSSNVGGDEDANVGTEFLPRADLISDLLEDSGPRSAGPREQVGDSHQVTISGR